MTLLLPESGAVNDPALRLGSGVSQRHDLRQVTVAEPPSPFRAAFPVKSAA
jgi:hypothetical protein